MKEKSNPNAPHVAMLRVHYEIMEVLPSGEASGWPIKDRINRIVVKGHTYEECFNKVNAIYDLLVEGLEG